MRRIAVQGPDAARAAAALIRSLRAGGVSVAATYTYADAPEPGSDFVTADGRFLPDEAFWLEWASDRPLDAAPTEDGAAVLVACDPAAVPEDGYERIDAVAMPADRFGRPTHALAGDAGASCRIGLLGDAHHHRHIYPAVLARIGDAADRTGVAVEPVIVPAAEAALPGVLERLHGMILPGGADMNQVAPQIAVAAHALARGLPVLGLCLGMQSMTTALVRASLWPDAAFEEVAGPGPHRSFVRMRTRDGTGLHRLGERPFRPVAGTRLGALLPDGAMLRMNHRYRFNPDIDATRLPAVLHWNGDIVDAVEVPAHPFFIGLQSHPELGCDPALPRVWDAFVQAAFANVQAGSSQ